MGLSLLCLFYAHEVLEWILWAGMRWWLYWMIRFESNYQRIAKKAYNFEMQINNQWENHFLHPSTSTPFSSIRIESTPISFPHFSQTNNPLGQSIHIRRDFLFAQLAERQIHSHHGYRAVFLCQFLHHTSFLLSLPNRPARSPSTHPARR